MSHKLLLVEDDENFGSLLCNYLQLSGYEVNWKNNGALGYSAYMQSTFDLCILDVMMPNMDGFTLARRIKEKSAKTPIIFLTAKNAREDLIEGYRSGADDYLTKPFDTEVLLLKIKAILNRYQAEENLPESKEIYTLGNFSFYPVSRKLVYKNEPEQKLSPKESLLLELLCQFENKVMPRDLALKKIWDESNYFTKRSMDVYITKLRKYLAPEPRIIIDTYHQMGFQLRVNKA
ncbi:MAG: response regulator transcription factor [Bacteroidetes bacterium]|nr:response regulator transcription factor [Bacteroidota bacterium]